MGLSKLVNFMGSRRDIPKILKELDIFVFSALEDEGFGIAIAEAMIAGIPILASSVGACLEILGNGKYGYFFEKVSEVMYTWTIIKKLDCFKNLKKEQKITMIFTELKNYGLD